jgi:DDE superfamily endonuclease
MLTLPAEIITLLMPFVPLFSPSVWKHAQVLLTGALLTPGQRTVTAALRAMGLAHTRQFQNYHRVLNRASWSPRQAAEVLLRLLVTAFVPRGPLLIGGDDTIERRRGDKIRAKGIYRDPVRSSHSHFVKTSGLRWLCLMLLVPVPFAQRLWALPFLTVLAPSERYQKEQSPQRQRHKTLVDWMRQALLQVRRWFPQRDLVLVADSSFAVLELLAALQQRKAPHQPITVVTRLRLDAALFEPAPLPPPGKKSISGRPRLKGKRLPSLQQRLQDPQTAWAVVQVPQWYGRARSNTRKSSNTGEPGKTSTKRQVRTVEPRLVEIATGTAVWYHTGKPGVPLRWVLVRDPQQEFEPQALLCTDATEDAVQVVQWFVSRWQVEVTFHEVRDHLGVETQRQWNDAAIARTTPVLLALFSFVTLLAQQLVDQQAPAVRAWGVRQSAWYVKEQATFTDALAWVRRHIWSHAQLPFCTSEFKPDREKLQQAVLERMTDLLCYAA